MTERPHGFQLMFDGLTKHMAEERAETQMTLGKLIDVLEQLDPKRMVLGLGELDSYRGYYCDLAFEPTAEARSVADLLAACRKAMGEVFTGYKGGKYVMGRNTPLWVSPYGQVDDDRLMALDTEQDPIQPKVEAEHEQD